MNNLVHAFITMSSIQNIFVMEIFSSGTLSRIHAPPHRIGWPVLTYQLPIALDENIHSIYRLTLKSLSLHDSNIFSCVLRSTCVALCLEHLFKHVALKSHLKDSCLMLKRDTMSSLKICCDIIRDIVEA